MLVHLDDQMEVADNNSHLGVDTQVDEKVCLDGLGGVQERASPGDPVVVLVVKVFREGQKVVYVDDWVTALVVKVSPEDQNVVCVGDPGVALACVVLAGPDNLDAGGEMVLLGQAQVAHGKADLGGLWVAHGTEATLGDLLEVLGRAFSVDLPMEADAFRVFLPTGVYGNDVPGDHPMGLFEMGVVVGLDHEKVVWV